MDKSGHNTKKRVLVSELKPGVYVAELDQSWFQTPLYFHRRLITDASEIELLKKSGIHEVVIDTARGANIDAAPIASAAGAGSTEGGRETELSAPAVTARHPSSTEKETIAAFTREFEIARSIHADALSAAKNIFAGVGSGLPINSSDAQRVVTNLLTTVARSPEANLLLTQIRGFETDLFTHAVNVCVLCLVVGTLEQLDSDISVLGVGALLHDVGKTRLPRNLLRKKPPYTEADRRLMEQHPQLGAMVVEQSGSVPEAVLHIIAQHHQRIDGSGFPPGIHSSELSQLSQLVGIIDTYDNMLSGLSYPRLQPIEILRQLFLQAKNGAFDALLVEQMIRSLGVYPAGSLVELDTGERAIVIAANRADTLKPTVRIVSGRDRTVITDGPLVDLAASGVDRRIVRALDPIREHLRISTYLQFGPELAVEL
jgi:putative nucleotidyltransferase with HDIG domain